MIKWIALFFLSFAPLLGKTPSLEEMIAQMIVVGFDGSKEGDKWVEQIAKDVQREKIGGVYLAPKNALSPSQLSSLTGYLKKQAPKHLPLFVLTQEEGGSFSLFSKGQKELPSAQIMSKTYDIFEAEKQYQERAKQLFEAGININFGPVLDLQPYQENPLERSYGKHEEIVSTYAMIFFRALKEEGIIPVVKYFPHAGELLENQFSKEVTMKGLWRFEQLKPYYDLFASGQGSAILVSHVLQPELDPLYPAVFSSTILESLLREKMRFKGVVFADNMRSGSLSSSIAFRERIIKAIQAGVDVFVFPNYFADNASIPFSVHKIISEAIRSKELSEERIKRSYARIEALKKTLNKRPVYAD